MRALPNVLAGALCALALGAAVPVRADDAAPVLTFTDGGFSPARLRVPAGETVKVVLRNDSKAPVEFESTRLKKEKVLAPGVTSFVVLHRVPAGDYAFIDDFNPAAGKGVIVAQ